MRRLEKQGSSVQPFTQPIRFTVVMEMVQFNRKDKSRTHLYCNSTPSFCYLQQRER